MVRSLTGKKEAGLDDHKGSVPVWKRHEDKAVLRWPDPFPDGARVGR